MRTGPDVQEHQGPEMDDRQPVGVDRPVRRLRDVIVHHAEEGRGQEEADGVVAVPPLDHRILDARPGAVALGPGDRDRQGEVVDDVEHRDGDDEGQVEPVGDVDVRFLALHHGAEIGDQVGHPHDGEPQVDEPFGLGVLLALRDAEQVAERRGDDEELVAQQHEPAERLAAEQAGAAGPLHHVEGRADQRGAAEGKDGGGRVQRPQSAERQVRAVEAELRPYQLGGDDDADQEGRDAPEHRQYDGRADHVVDITRRRTLVGCQYGLARHAHSPNNRGDTRRWRRLLP
jgi:23S rRNA (cytosine1962-C5)-methyltransferase